MTSSTIEIRDNRPAGGTFAAQARGKPEEKEEKHMGYMEEYKFWLEAPYFDPKTKRN